MSWLCGSLPPSVSASSFSGVHSRAQKSRIAATKSRCSSVRPWSAGLLGGATAIVGSSLQGLSRFEAAQLTPRDRLLVHLVGTVGDPQPAALTPHQRQRHVVR